MFPMQLELGAKILRFFGDQKRCDQLKLQLSTLPEGTIGKELFQMMEANSLSFVPWYEKHDLKHLILGYRQAAPDEMRMQAFMFGNSGFPFFITIVTCFFLIWTPDVWPELPRHYRAGKQVKPIGGIPIERIMHRNLEEFRREIGIPKV